MTMDDRELANLLGETPGPDPAFRFDVLARAAARKRRRASLHRAVEFALGFTCIGLAFALAHAAGVTLAETEPLLQTAGVLGAAALIALFFVNGPMRTLARSRALLRI